MGVGSGMFQIFAQNTAYISQVKFMSSPCVINDYKLYVVQYCTDSDRKILSILYG